MTNASEKSWITTVLDKKIPGDGMNGPGQPK